MDGQMSIFDFKEYLPDQYVSKRGCNDYLEDELLKGSGFDGGKDRIFYFFKENSDEKQREEFLKKEYGVGGWSTSKGIVNHDSSGIDYLFDEPIEKTTSIHMGWMMVAREIEKLIASGKYKPSCKWKSKCHTYNVGCKGLVHWCEMFKDVLCEDALKCERFPDGCGGTISVCRYGGPYERNQRERL